MTTKPFRINYYPKDAFIDRSELSVEEIGVLTQIENLVYIHNGSVEYDAKHIGKSCNITPARCERLIDKLINRQKVFITKEGRISQKRCVRELKELQERIEKYSKNGKKGSESRWGNDENQLVSDGDGNHDLITSISINNNTNKNINNPDICSAGFDIDLFLSGDDWEKISEMAPNWGRQDLIAIFNEYVTSGAGEIPKHPKKAFFAWIVNYTKGKDPY